MSTERSLPTCEVQDYKTCHNCGRYGRMVRHVGTVAMTGWMCLGKGCGDGVYYTVDGFGESNSPTVMPASPTESIDEFKESLGAHLVTPEVCCDHGGSTVNPIEQTDHMAPKSCGCRPEGEVFIDGLGGPFPCYVVACDFHTATGRAYEAGRRYEHDKMHGAGSWDELRQSREAFS